MGLLRKTITYAAGGINVPGFFCMPQGRSSCPAVIVLHGSDGFKPNHEAIALRLANEGFAALAPSWFGGASTRSHWRALRAEDILQSVDFLKHQPSVDAGTLGLIGFSRGGGLALIMASMIPQVKAVVNYFGLVFWKGGLAEFDHLPLNPSQPLDFIRNLYCPVLSFHGKDDTVVSAENTMKLDVACKKYGVEHRYVLYPGVDHSFVWPGDKYNQNAHQDSWELTLEFLKTHLGQGGAK